MELKPGYKQTEVGVIPEEWDVTPLGNHFKFKNGLNKAKEFFGFGTPIVNYMDVYKHSTLKTENIQGCVDVNANERMAYEVRKGDVFFTRTSETVDEIGMASTIVDAPKDMVFSGFILRARPIDQSFDNKFKGYCFASAYFRKQVTARASYTTRALTNGRALSMALIAKPPLPEQRAIATALSDVDALLDGLDRLISKKRDVKQAAMQQLLTGKTRLPGFEGEWATKEWGVLISHCSSGSTPYRGRPEYYKGNIRWITSGELNYNVIYDTLEHISYEAVRKANLTIHPPGTFLMAITGLEAAGTRGACGIVGAPSTTNQSCMAIYPTLELDSSYLFQYYLYKGDSLAYRYCQGTKQQSYTAKLVKKLPIALPPTIEEQIIIAQVLSDMDAEISALEKRRAKTLDLKQAMMQELLTGRTRLI